MAINGLVVMAPSSVAVGSGTASINTNGSVSITNAWRIDLRGVFSADFDNYLISISDTHTTSSSALEFNLITGTTVDYDNFYTNQSLWAYGSTISGGRSTNASSARVGQVEAGQPNGVQAYIFGPFLTQPTALRGVTATGYQSATIEDYACTHSKSSSYNGCRFAAAGETTGVITVFGFNQ